MDWNSLLNDLLVPDISLLEKILRPIIVYFTLVLLLRLFGKRALAQLNSFDLVVLLMLANTVQNAIIGNDNSVVGGLLGAVALLVTNWLVVRFVYKHQKIDALVEGQPILLVDQGRVIRKNLQQQLITEPELLAACHRQGIERIEQVEKAILESNGTISIFTRHPTREESFDEQVARRLDAIEQMLRTMHAGMASNDAASDLNSRA